MEEDGKGFWSVVPWLYKRAVTGQQGQVVGEMLVRLQRYDLMLDRELDRGQHRGASSGLIKQAHAVAARVNHGGSRSNEEHNASTGSLSSQKSPPEGVKDHSLLTVP